MKPKGLNAPRSRTSKGKIIKKELPSEEIINMPAAYNVQPSARPSVEIVKCISFQKFRYSGENRPGKKYQEKEFMTLKLSNLQDKVVRVVIICTDADNRELIHPNGLVGKDCHDGIYDKEYAVTKQFFLIKIPYLRTERMKTKKNEHKNILGVLSSRASHLPSPYRERCLSQCTDKYTSSREKFDTTKVCLGVIVTVESHPGILNGSLHAISHVVRNASEKTALSILKLSNDSIPALTGAYIDIFTTEDGPAIEPDKYVVFVASSSDNHGTDSWKSSKFAPQKEDLLYKRVITYQVPPYEPNLNLDSPVEVMLHLECPQSNQYCCTTFHYVPQGEVVIVDEQDYIRGSKRNTTEHDMKPSPKRFRAEIFENDGSSETIRANLKTKIKARNETPNNMGTVCADNQDDSQEEDGGYVREHKQRKTYSQDCPVLIHHQDPQTGESSYLLDMDASKSNSSNTGTATFVDGENQYVFQFQDKSPNILQSMKSVKGNGSIIQSNPQDLKVVATGYSDTVPANTVLVYTTNGILSDRVDDGTLEHVLIQGGSRENPVVFTHSPSFRRGEKHVSLFANDSVPASSIHTSANAQIIKGNAITNKRSSTYTSELTGSDGKLEEDRPNSDCTVLTADRLAATQLSQIASTSNSVSPSTSSLIGRYSPVPTSFASAIPPLRRMLISNKTTMSNNSPWEVDNGDDCVSDYNIVIKSFEKPDERATSQPLDLKSEPLDEDPFRQRSEFYVQTVPLVRIAENKFHRLRGNPYIKENNDGDDTHTAASEGSTVRDDLSVPNSVLSSMEVAEAIVNNLPTMQILEIAEDFENSMSNAETEEGTQNNQTFC